MTATPLLPPLKVGNLTISPPLLLAPMAGITDLPFRLVCKPFGVGLMVTEMIASRAIEQKRDRTERMGLLADAERPVSVQIAGADPDYMQTAARWAVAQGADIVDINMGCPVKKVVKQVAGSALLRDEPLVARILQAVVAAVEVPVTLKIRTGWDEQNKNVQNIARIAEECGVQMLTVHGRTRQQLFHGHANWEDIGLAKQATGIPVVGNGDVVDAASAREMVRISGCDGVMVGRAVQGNPWVLGEVAAALTGCSPPPPLTPEQRWQLIEQHMHLLAEHHGERTASQLARKHLPWYSKGLNGAAEFRSQIQKQPNRQAQLDYARQFFLQLTINN